MLRWFGYSLLCAFALLAFLTSYGADGAVMSIDYGTEWFKVGLIKPGIPLDVALNKDSKRKTQAVVTIRDNQRLYGSDAVSLAGRFPHLTYFNLKSIAGKPYHDKHSEEYRQRFVNAMQVDPARNMPVFLHNNTDMLPVEELIAYQFQNAKEQAAHAAGEEVKDVVITITPFATQSERQAILDAAELAGLNVLSLMHDETAVALNYAISREFSKTPEHHIFYDMGAGSTVASVVSFSMVDVKEGRKTRTVPQLEVKAVGFDRTLGGHEFDVRLQRHLADGFMKQHAARGLSSIYESDGAMTRLLKEANRVKQILSANTEVFASVEGLHEETDFKMKVTRAELEKLCSDLFERVPGPILSALKAAEMKADDIKSLVLVGGSVRIPSVQNGIVKVIGTQRIAKNVNADEAAVLGAAFRGASLSNQFRLTKQIKIKDITVFPVEVTYAPEEGAPLRTTLFKEYGSIGTRKLMAFKCQNDFEFDISYGKTTEEHDKAIGLDEIAKVKVTGLTEALEPYREVIDAAEQPPKVRVAIEMSDSGVLSVPEAFVTIELDSAGKTTFTDKVKSFFGSKDEKPATDEASANSQNETADANKTESQNKADTEPEAKKEIKKIALHVDYTPTGPAPLSKAQKVSALGRIKQLDLLDKKRRLREESRNALESFVYKLQDFLYDDTVAIVSTSTEQDHLRDQLSETSDWLYDEGEHADTSAYVKRLEALQQLEKPIAFRKAEYLQRDENVKKLDSSIELARAFLSTVETTPEEERYHSKEELEGLSKVIDQVEVWKKAKVAAQEALADHVDPVLTTADVDTQSRVLDDVLMKLMLKKKPKKVTKKEEKPTEEKPVEEEAAEGNPPKEDATSEAPEKAQETKPKETVQKEEEPKETSEASESEDADQEESRRHDEL